MMTLLFIALCSTSYAILSSSDSNIYLCLILVLQAKLKHWAKLLIFYIKAYLKIIFFEKTYSSTWVT
jgi:hypothetical protein